MVNKIHKEKLTETLHFIVPDQKVCDIRKALLETGVIDAEDIEFVEIPPEELFRVEKKMRNCQPLTEKEEILTDYVIKAKIRGKFQLNHDKIKIWREFILEKNPNEILSSLSYKEFVRLILLGEIKINKKHICELKPDMQESMGFQFETEGKEE